MARIYLSKREADHNRRDFHLSDKPLTEIVEQFGVRPEDREPIPEHVSPEERLLLVVSIPEEEAEGSSSTIAVSEAIITADVVKHLTSRLLVLCNPDRNAMNGIAWSRKASNWAKTMIP